MSVSKLLPQGGANDFNVAITGTYTAVTFTKEYGAGGYSIVSSVGDSTLDIYSFNSDGSSAGYTSTKSFTATKGFNKMVILGGTSGDLLTFTYKQTFISENETAEVTAGPVITSITPSAAPNVNDTIAVTGRNFASDVAVTFTSGNSSYAGTAAKNIVRTNATSLIVTRPDNLTVGFSPYTLTVTNPGINAPIGSNSHILSNALTAGSSPVWVTGAILSYTVGASTTLTLSATDADPSSVITYSVASGTLPSGFSLNGSTGAITGTPTTSNVTVTFRATDSGGNFADKAILMNANPVWTTAAGALPKYVSGFAFTTTVAATDDNTAVSYSVVSGALPSGFTLASTSGVISGTSTDAGTASFTIRASDTNSATTDRAFTLQPATAVIVNYTTVGSTTFTLPSTANPLVQYLVVAGGGSGGDGNGGGGGGGAGSMIEGTYTSLTPGSSYTVTIGDGGAAHGSSGGDNNTGSLGGNSVFNTATALGGGAGQGYNGGASVNGGCGGGGTDQRRTGGNANVGTVPAGATGYAFGGGNFNPAFDAGGGGGGAGGAGQMPSSQFSSGSGGASRSNSLTGSAYNYCGGGPGSSYGSGSQVYSDATQFGWGGGGAYDNRSAAGFKGTVVVKYYT
jgi:hypothetical protein